ncbi:MAG: hypothetical protein R2690_20360 [Acidimicrobiales bacterium]
MREVDGKVAVVTGGAGGVGKALGACFADAGMRGPRRRVRRSAGRRRRRAAPPATT